MEAILQDRQNDCASCTREPPHGVLKARDLTMRDSPAALTEIHDPQSWPLNPELAGEASRGNEADPKMQIAGETQLLGGVNRQGRRDAALVPTLGVLEQHPLRHKPDRPTGVSRMMDRLGKPGGAERPQDVQQLSCLALRGFDGLNASFQSSVG
jgi:hypothetical protein